MTTVTKTSMLLLPITMKSSCSSYTSDATTATALATASTRTAASLAHDEQEDLKEVHDDVTLALSTTLDDDHDDDHDDDVDDPSSPLSPQSMDQAVWNGHVSSTVTVIEQQKPTEHVFKQPFFLLDWLEDLVPEHHDPERLAELLNTPQKKNQLKSNRRHSSVYQPTTTSTSASALSLFTKDTKELSPLQRFFSSWNIKHLMRDDDAVTALFDYETTPDSTRSMPELHDIARTATTSTTSTAYIYKSDEDEGGIGTSNSSPTSCMSMPGTPKSSNRRKTKILLSINGDGSDDDDDDRIGSLPVPTRLQDQLDRMSLSSTTSLPIMPSMTSLPTSTSSSTTTPSFDLQRRTQRAVAAQLLQKRRRQRQELRAKQGIFTRSLLLAQTWNQKGLQKVYQSQQQMMIQEDENATNHDDQQVVYDDNETADDTSTWSVALECWDNALEIYQTLLGSSHPHVANVQNNRGIALGKLQRYKQALQALHAALSIRQKELLSQVCDDSDTCTKAASSSINPTSNGIEHDPVMSVVNTLHNIANVHQESGHSSEALQVLVQAKEVLWQQEVFDRTNSKQRRKKNKATQDAARYDFHRWHQSARLCTAMGHVYYQAEQCKDAREAYQDSLEIYERLLVEQKRQSQEEKPRRNLKSSVEFQTPEEQELMLQELLNLRVDMYELDLQQQQQDEEHRRRYCHQQQYEQHQTAIPIRR